jgi:SAM-dependent methyltransferase
MNNEAPKAARYHPGIFDTADVQRAKEVILTSEGEWADTATRWERETPYVLELLQQTFILGPETTVLDYGCGIGRTSKAMIDASGCSVIGVDISHTVRDMPRTYIGSDRFIAVSPSQFDGLVAGGFRVHAAIAVWVLQHCLVPADDIARIKAGLVSDGRAFVLNMPKRAVPAVFEDTNQFAWAHDDIDVAVLLKHEFRLLAGGEPDRTRTPNMANGGAYWMSLANTGRPSPDKA